MHDAGRLGQTQCVRVRVCVCCVCCVCSVCVCCVCIYYVCISKLSNCLCCCRYEWTHTQTHTLTTYGVNKLQAIAQGLNWSQERERGIEREREVAGHDSWRQLNWPSHFGFVFYGPKSILWQMQSIFIYLLLLPSLSPFPSPTPAPTPVPTPVPTPASSSLVCRTCRVFVQLANSKQIKNKQQPETGTTTTTITIGATTTITSRTNSYVTEQNRTWSKAQPKML